jgi:hypothetical protein
MYFRRSKYIISCSLNTIGRTLHSQVHNLVDFNWNKESLPQQQKEIIIALFFKTRDQTDWSNFCGISLPSTSHKIVSNIPLARVAQHVNEIISEI